VTTSSLAPGLLVLMLGVFLISRTVTRDDTGRTLIDRILGHPGQSPAAQAAAARGFNPANATEAAIAAGAVAGPPAPGAGSQTPAVHDLPHGAPRAVVRR
jgi:transcription elongation factor